MMAPFLAGTDRRWRYRTDWRGRLVLQVCDQPTTTSAGSSAAMQIQAEWRDARVEDLHEWGGAA